MNFELFKTLKTFLPVICRVIISCFCRTLEYKYSKGMYAWFSCRPLGLFVQ